MIRPPNRTQSRTRCRFLSNSITCASCPTCTAMGFKKWCVISRGRSALGRIRLLGGLGHPAMGGREPNRKLAVSYSSFSPRYCGWPKKDKVEIKVCNIQFPYKKAEPLLTLPLKISLYRGIHRRFALKAHNPDQDHLEGKV